jgi:hypothetical protein
MSQNLFAAKLNCCALLIVNRYVFVCSHLQYLQHKSKRTSIHLTSIHLCCTKHLSSHTAAQEQDMSSRIAETIRTLDQKDVISLWHCGLGDVDAAALADALKVNTSVTTIDLGGNQIGNEGAAALVDALLVNTSLTFIKLYGNRSSASILTTFRESADRNKCLRHLFLYDARRMLLSLMCADECGVVWPHLLERGDITDGVAAPDDIDALRATFASIVAARQLQQ